MDSWRAARFPELPGRAPATRIRDTSSGRLVTAAAGRVATLYACGITPYDATHIGHAATFIAWDLLVRSWRDAGHEVSYVQNVTDVDDPLLERATRDGVGWRDLADREIARYRADMQALRVLPPDHYVGAVEALGVIERFNQLLADRGALYDLDGDIYFTRSADAAFGTVAGLDPPTMLVLAAERGGDPGRAGKKDPLDPVVWVAARPGEPAWESGFGSGRPGWHVECAAIAAEYLGVSFDVQAGGTDLAFPHHEMSASHARVALGGTRGPAGPVFARSYAHAGMVRLDGEKMSKSRGNLVFVSRLLAAGTDPMAIRLAIIAHHYAEDWDWTEQGLAAAGARLARWRRALSLATTAIPGSSGPPSPETPSAAAPSAAAPSAAAVSARSDVLGLVRARLADDLDAPGAIAAVDSWAAAVIAAAGSPSAKQAGTAGQARAGTAGQARAGATGQARAAEARLVADTVDALLGIELRAS
jgi:L-cysteine:1D-myo-inositol 2-amino-2-deoxy-alpha-D-glucopyranoside ligase